VYGGQRISTPGVLVAGDGLSTLRRAFGATFFVGFAALAIFHLL
jgi:hypothetical protein